MPSFRSGLNNRFRYGTPRSYAGHRFSSSRARLFRRRDDERTTRAQLEQTTRNVFRESLFLILFYLFCFFVFTTVKHRSAPNPVSGPYESTRHGIRVAQGIARRRTQCTLSHAWRYDKTNEFSFRYVRGPRSGGKTRARRSPIMQTARVSLVGINNGNVFVLRRRAFGTVHTRTHAVKRPSRRQRSARAAWMSRRHYAPPFISRPSAACRSLIILITLARMHNSST